jgi:hypothetical protein
MTLHSYSSENLKNFKNDILSKFSNLPNSIDYLKGDLNQLPEFRDECFIKYHNDQDHVEISMPKRSSDNNINKQNSITVNQDIIESSSQENNISNHYF